MTGIYSCLENNDSCLKRKKEFFLVVLLETFYYVNICFIIICSITRFAMEDTEYYTIEDQKYCARVITVLTENRQELILKLL